MSNDEKEGGSPRAPRYSDKSPVNPSLKDGKMVLFIKFSKGWFVYGSLLVLVTGFYFGVLQRNSVYAHVLLALHWIFLFVLLVQSVIKEE